MTHFDGGYCLLASVGMTQKENMTVVNFTKKRDFLTGGSVIFGGAKSTDSRATGGRKQNGRQAEGFPLFGSAAAGGLAVYSTHRSICFHGPLSGRQLSA